MNRPIQSVRGAVFYESLLLFAIGLSALLDFPVGAPPSDQHIVSIPILMYHHVGDWGAAKADWAPWVVRPKDFSAQLDWLSVHNFHTITFQELLAYRAENARPPVNSVIISFDDGWAEQADIARTQLEPRGMRGVFFIYTGPIASQDNGSGYMSWNQVRQLEAAGHEVQSHTVSHPRLTEVPPSRLENEMTQSRTVIEAQVHHPVEVIAYPFGLHDERVMAAARRAGYRLGVRADDDAGIGPPLEYRLPRLKMNYGEGIDVFAGRMAASAAK